MKTMFATAVTLLSATAHAVVGAMNYDADFDYSGDSSGLLFAVVVVAVIFYLCYRADNK